MSTGPADGAPAAGAAGPARPAPAQPAQPRLRILAGPNGSGKSTIMSELKPQWIGVFVNADEMERDLASSQGRLGLHELGLRGAAPEVLQGIRSSLGASGLEARLDVPALLAGMTIDAGLRLQVPGPYDSYLASALAEAVRGRLLDERRTFTFETVMSHPSKIAFMADARARGYRVYLYFVATDDPDINIDRVRRRVMQGGHPVDDRKVIERYGKSIGLMTRACEIAHRAYIFDNSGSRHKLLAEVVDFETIELASSRINPWFLRTDLWKAFS